MQDTDYAATAREANAHLTKIEDLINTAPMGLDRGPLLRAKETAEAYLQHALDRRAAAAAERERNSPKARLQRALTAVRREGVKVRQNVGGCCRGCISREDLGAVEGQPYAYTYGGQGQAYRWDDAGERATYRRGDAWTGSRTVDSIHFNHGDGAAPLLAAALRAEGLTVEWDGSEGQTVAVVLG